VRLSSILVLRVSRALELRIGLRAELQGGDPLGPPAQCVLCFTAWLVYCVGRMSQSL
jgi:hypothetical protein